MTLNATAPQRAGSLVRILLVDDHSVVREGIRTFLERTPDLRVVGEANNAQTALQQVRDGQWDLVMLDLCLPDQTGLETLRRIKDEKPELPVLIFSAFSEESHAVQCLTAGASGYLPKDCEPEDIRSAIRTTARGQRYISPSLSVKLLEAATRPAKLRPHELLSPRELDVMIRIGGGQGLTEIGKELDLAPKTISSHKARIMEKMGFASNADFTRYVDANNLAK